VPHSELNSASPYGDSLDRSLGEELLVLRGQDLERSLRVLSRREGALVEMDAGPAVDFSSNDYLGLASDPRLAAAMARAAELQGSGSTASRLIAGTNVEHEALEAELADWLGCPAALSFSSGYAANTGIIPALVGREDLIFSDRLNHASLIDGCRLSRAAVHVYEHASAASLKSLLLEHRQSGRRALIVTDGMFSMDGDTAPLAEIALLARRHDAWTYVDDAHALGVTGETGRGTASVLGVLGEIDVLVGTLGKAFGSAGAFVAGSRTLRDFLINRARSFVFSTAPSPAQAAASREALRIIRHDDERRARVAANAERLRAALAGAGISPMGIDESHIVPVLIGESSEAARVGAAMADAGFLVGAVRPPTVPAGTSRIRLTVSAEHTAVQIDAMALALAESLASVGVGSTT
jgi:8-amino-7-oxononanoate synthase